MGSTGCLMARKKWQSRDDWGMTHKAEDYFCYYRVDFARVTFVYISILHHNAASSPPLRLSPPAPPPTEDSTCLCPGALP